MALYARLLGIETKIPIHQFQAVVADWARGQSTAAQARQAILDLTGVALTAGEETEVQQLVATVPTGSTTANQAARALRMLEIDQVLLLADSGIRYTTVAALKTRLGVP